MNLLRSEAERLLARRMTRWFPAGLAAAFVVGVAIAYLVVTNNDGSIDFLTDIAGGDGSDTLGPVATLLPVMAFVIGASYVGADLKTGMMEQILTWEPRRLRILAGRTVISILGVGVIAALLAAFLVVLLYGLAAATGTTGGVPAEVWANIATSVARTGLAAGLFAAFGLGVTLLLDNSLASIVGFVIYWFVVEGFLIQVLLPRVAVYLPVTNAAAFAQGSPVQRLAGSLFSDEGPQMIDHHDYLVAGIILAGWTLVALALSGLAFWRRDIA
jgi:ABC-2 type transport system permease protein